MLILKAYALQIRMDREAALIVLLCEFYPTYSPKFFLLISLKTY